MSWLSTVSPSISDSDIISGLDADQDNWSCADWKLYYTRIKSKYGQQTALQTVETDVGNTGWFADVNDCKYDCDFVNFFTSEGIGDVGNIFSKLYCGTSNTVSAVTGAVTNVASVASNITQSAKFVTSPVILVSAVALLGYLYYKKNGKR